jgi:hypothetical protein
MAAEKRAWRPAFPQLLPENPKEKGKSLRPNMEFTFAGNDVYTIFAA